MTISYINTSDPIALREKIKEIETELEKLLEYMRDKNGVVKSCKTCEHEKESVTEHPCCLCILDDDFSLNWESKK